MQQYKNTKHNKFTAFLLVMFMLVGLFIPFLNSTSVNAQSPAVSDLLKRAIDYYCDQTEASGSYSQCSHYREKGYVPRVNVAKYCDSVYSSGNSGWDGCYKSLIAEAFVNYSCRRSLSAESFEECQKARRTVGAPEKYVNEYCGTGNSGARCSQAIASAPSVSVIPPSTEPGDTNPEPGGGDTNPGTPADPPGAGPTTVRDDRPEIDPTTVSNFGEAITSDCIESSSKEKCGITKWLDIGVKTLTGAFGVVVVCMLAYSGARYTMARDDPNAIAEAKSRIRTIIMMIVAYAVLWAFLQWVMPGGVLNA